MYVFNLVLLVILICTAIRGGITIAFNHLDSFYFTDCTKTKSSVQIPPNALYSGTNLATDIKNSTGTYNLTCKYNTGTQFFSGMDTTSTNHFLIFKYKYVFD